MHHLLFLCAVPKSRRFQSAVRHPIATNLPVRECLGKSRELEWDRGRRNPRAPQNRSSPVEAEHQSRKLAGPASAWQSNKCHRWLLTFDSTSPSSEQSGTQTTNHWFLTLLFWDDPPSTPLKMKMPPGKLMVGSDESFCTQIAPFLGRHLLVFKAVRVFKNGPLFWVDIPHVLEVPRFGTLANPAFCAACSACCAASAGLVAPRAAACAAPRATAAARCAAAAAHKAARRWASATGRPATTVTSLEN